MYLSQHITEILLLMFMIITFGLSGLEKVLDWSEQTTFLHNHFSGTFLQKPAKFLLGILVILDLLCVVFSSLGVFQMLVSNSMQFSQLASVIAATILLCMLIGQRIAKDYAGALTITCYFMVIIFAVWLFHSS